MHSLLWIKGVKVSRNCVTVFVWWYLKFFLLLEIKICVESFPIIYSIYAEWNIFIYYNILSDF